MSNTIVCGNIPGLPHRHASVSEVRGCWVQYQAEVAEAAEERWAEDAAVRAAEAAEERWAEDAAVRAAEAGTPETWAEEDLDRLIELYGYGPPCR